jgi:hypothetical protein
MEMFWLLCRMANDGLQGFLPYKPASLPAEPVFDEILRKSKRLCRKLQKHFIKYQARTVTKAD